MTPKLIVDAIEARTGVTGKPCQVRDAIERELLDKFKTTAAQAAEKSYQLYNKVVSEIARRKDEREAAGEIAVLHLRGSKSEILYGSSFVFFDDSDVIRTSKLNRISVDEIYYTIRNLSFAQFELFGRCILRELGCHVSQLTPQSGDQGIDFYGELTVGNLLKFDPAIVKLMHDTRIVIVGQAKHYPGRTIGPATIRELVGALSLSKTNTYTKDKLDLLDGVRLKPFSPLLAMLFSTGDFTKGARTLAERAGLIVFSG
ncbi:MAG: restriction endonuclease, partial [Reyranella sp.]|nr:restriction endonuclease [Reyranella sp.]